MLPLETVVLVVGCLIVLIMLLVDLARIRLQIARVDREVLRPQSLFGLH